jgi:hypothetical protein
MKVQFIALYVKQWVDHGGLKSIDISIFGILPRTALENLMQKYDHMRKLIHLQSFFFPPSGVTGNPQQALQSTNDTVNIPTKPTPIGFKIWVLADQGYVFDLLWHVKGDGKDQGPHSRARGD